MVDDDSALPPATGRQRQLEDRRAALRARIDTLTGPSPDGGSEQGAAGEVAELKRQLEEVERQLDCIVLAAEMARQQDA